MALDLDYFQKQLEEEKHELENKLKTIAHRNPDAPEDWDVNYPNLNIMTAAKDEIASQEEAYENRASLELGLESRLKDINDALERIRHNKYGFCEVGKEMLDEARLRANPAANTCVKHAKPV